MSDATPPKDSTGAEPSEALMKALAAMLSPQHRKSFNWPVVEITPQVKTIRLNAAHHRTLKIHGINHGMSMQLYLTALIEFALSKHPMVQLLREEFFLNAEFRSPEDQSKEDE